VLAIGIEHDTLGASPGLIKRPEGEQIAHGLLTLSAGDYNMPPPGPRFGRGAIRAGPTRHAGQE
jgi:hypothetical protein